MKKLTIIAKPNGDIEFLGGGQHAGKLLHLPLGTMRKRRVSIIEPLWEPKRTLFRLLRHAFGDEGKVAAYTRTWRGPWKCRILATGAWSVFEYRSNALRWEEQQVTERLEL
jgi:hypothetical protein